MVTEKEIREAYVFLRKNNHTIPDEVLDFMLEASLRSIVGLAENDMIDIINSAWEDAKNEKEGLEEW